MSEHGEAYKAYKPGEVRELKIEMYDKSHKLVRGVFDERIKYVIVESKHGDRVLVNESGAEEKVRLWVGVDIEK